MVLFTNHSDLKETYHRTSKAFQKMKRLLLAQGMEYSRSELRQRLISTGNATLLGADSFWTGVDVLEPLCLKSLSHDFLSKIPIIRSTKPVVNISKSQGGRPFSEMVIPDALIKFRQGIGRLIRKQSDSGNLIILDSNSAKTLWVPFYSSTPHQKVYAI